MLTLGFITSAQATLIGWLPTMMGGRINVNYDGVLDTTWNGTRT